jgi:hypothetical protein
MSALTASHSVTEPDPRGPRAAGERGWAGRRRAPHGTDVLFRAQAASQEATLAVCLRDHLSPEVGSALAAPWTAVFGDPVALDPNEDAPSA